MPTPTLVSPRISSQRRWQRHLAVVGSVAIIVLIAFLTIYEQVGRSFDRQAEKAAILRVPLVTLSADEVGCFMRRHGVHDLLAMLPDRSGAAIAAMSGADLRNRLGADRKLQLTLSLLDKVRTRGVLRSHLVGCSSSSSSVGVRVAGGGGGGGGGAHDDAKACDPAHIERSPLLNKWRADEECLRRPRGTVDPNGYIELLEVREQMNQAVFFLRDDAVWYAKILDRTLVEPVVAHSRVTRSAGADGHPLSLLFDLKAICKWGGIRLIDYASFEELKATHRLSAQRASPRTKKEDKPGGVRLRSSEAVYAYFNDALRENPDVLQLTGFWRSGISRGQYQKGLKFQLQPLHHIEADSVIDRCIGRPFMSIQWRTEWIKNWHLEECTRSFVATVTAERDRLQINRIHLSSDLMPGNSDTYDTSSSLGARSINPREKALHYTWSILQPESRVTAYLATIADAGHRGVVEMLIAIKADAFLSGTDCSLPSCAKCAKSNSGFGRRIISERKEMNRISIHAGWNRTTFNVIAEAGGELQPPFSKVLS